MPARIGAAIAIIMILTGTIAMADDNLTGIVLSGTWQSVNASAGRSLTLEFIDGECAIRMRAEREELFATGPYQQEATKLYVILRQSVTAETQFEIPYEVIDADTIEVTVNKKRFTLERQN